METNKSVQVGYVNIYRSGGGSDVHPDEIAAARAVDNSESRKKLVGRVKITTTTEAIPLQPHEINK